VADKAEAAVACLAAGVRFRHRSVENSRLAHYRAHLAIGTSAPRPLKHRLSVVTSQA